jgi:hypothetical protein
MMKLLAGWAISAALVVASAAAANAQVLNVQAPYRAGNSTYTAVSDVSGPYAEIPREGPAPRYGYGPSLLPPQEVYAVLRDNGFSPLGAPQQRGMFYTIAVVDRGGEDGRLVIDARNGRIVRFMPGGRIGDNFNEDMSMNYGAMGALPPINPVRGVPRPPASVPHVASRMSQVPMPKASPPHAGEERQLAAKPNAEPAPQPPAVIEAKPTPPQIQPTQEMPKAQGLE